MTLTRLGIFVLLSIGASLDIAGAEDTHWTTIFEENFDDNPMNRFKMLPVPEPGTTSSGGSGRYDKTRHAYTLGGRLSLVRPFRAGPHVEFGLTLRFSPFGAEDPPKLETDLMFVLFDKSMVGVQVHRTQEVDSPTVVKFVEERPAPAQTRILREIELPRRELDGDWLLRYRHGLLTLDHGTNTIGGASIGRLGISVAGVSWLQKGGQVTCEGMFVKGEQFPVLDPEAQERLQRASRTNEEAKKLYQEGKHEDALAKMKEASALFVEVHGEENYDSANSFTNLASILESMGQMEEAATLWTKALAIHEKTLGANHPHTTLTRFNLGKHFFSAGEGAKAKELWTRCRDDWKATLGPEYSTVKSLDSILSRL